MAKKLVFDYTFSPATDSITVDGNVSLKKLLLITNVTKNIILYNFADSTKGVTSASYDVSTNKTTIVFKYDCAAMATTDALQIFIDEEAQRFEPIEPLTDPVSKFRVSEPNTLIDTDFEYGLQSSKWESVERMNEIPAFHSQSGDVPLSNIIDVTVNGTTTVTVTCSSPHGINTGTPIDVRGIDSSTAEGTFVVKRTTDYLFTFEARAIQQGTLASPVSIFTSYTTISPGRFYVGANITLDNTAANTTGTIITNGTTTLTVRTPYDHGFKPNATFALVNSLSKNAITFDPRSVTSSGQVDDRNTLSISTGTFTWYEPFHQGTIRRSIQDTNINTTTNVITITNHGLMTGDPIAYVGVSNGGATPSVNAVGAGDFTISAGALPQWDITANTGKGIVFAVVIDKDSIKVATNPRDAYNNTNLIVFNGRGSGIHEFALFKRGDRLESSIASFSTTNASSVMVVTLNGLNTNNALGIVPGQQITIAGAGVAALNGVWSVRSNNWTATGNTFEMEGPTDASGVLVNQTATQAYTLTDSGGNGTTSFDRYNIYTTVGCRFVAHTSPWGPNHVRVSIHDWKATNAKYWFRQCVNPGTDRVFVKNHGLTTGEPVLFVGGGNTWSGGATNPADGTVYFVNVITRDTFEVWTTENLAGTGPFSTATTGSKVNFTTASPTAGGVYAFHPGFTVNNFTTAASTGGAGTGRDRAIAQFANIPAYIQENTPIVLVQGSGSTLPTGLTNTPNTYTSYQKYYIESINTANTAGAVKEFSLTTQPQGAPINFSANATQGAGKFYAFRIEENAYSNSFYLINHGGTAATQTVGGTGIQGTYPTGFDYPGPLFDVVLDATGFRWPRVRTTLTWATPGTGLTTGNVYYMVPVTNDIFKVMSYAVGTLPTGQPTVQITSVSGASATLSFANTAVQNVTANRIIFPRQTQIFVENALVRYENLGGVDIGSAYTTAPGLVNNNQYIVKNVTTDVPLTVPGTLFACTASTTSITINDTTRLAIGDYIKVANEVMVISNITGASSPYTLTVTRGANNTTAAAYEDGQVVDKLYGTFQLFTTTQIPPRTFSIAAASADATNDRWTFTNHGLRTAETVMVTSTGTGGTWAGTTSVLYYVIVWDANTFSLALSPALAYAQYPIDITAAGSTTWVFDQFYSSIPLAGLSTSTVPVHSLEDTSSTGTLDGGYIANTVPTSTQMTFTTTSNVATRDFYVDPTQQLNLADGIFYIPNHGFSTGTPVTYSKNGLTYAIGDSATGVYDSYNKLTDSTVYYVISRTLDAFQIATTKANALAGVPITRLSGVGSTGSHKLSTAQVAGDSLAGGLATVVARDIVVNGSSSAVVTAASDRIVLNNHGFNTGDRVVYQVWAGGTQINGLINGRQYFVSNSVFTGATAGGAASGQTANQFSLHNSWVGAYTNTDRADILGVGTGTVHQFKVTNPTLTGTTFKGEWNATDNYYFGDIVSYRNAFYMSVTGTTTGTANTNQQPINDSTLYNLNWQVTPALPTYSTRFLTGYRGGDTIRLSNTIPRRTIYFDASSASRVIVADNTINFGASHGLTTGEAVVYKTDALGGSSQNASSNYSAYVSGLPQTPVGGLVVNQIYYVNVLDSQTISLHLNPAEARRGGSGDTGNFQYAVNITSTGTGAYHRFEVVEHATYTVQVLAVNNDKEMVVTDPYPSRALSFNPQEYITAVAGITNQVVNTATDEIYIPGHGLVTGVKVYYSIGAANSGTVIGGLSDGGTYFVIRVNDDTIRLATNLVSALNATAIDLTSTGSGFAHYLIAATACGSSWIRYTTGGIPTSGAITGGTVFYTGQTDANIRDGVMTALPIMLETQLYVRPDCMNVHRPFDGGVELNASNQPNVSIVRQTRKYFRYQSGKGLQYSTGINFSPSIDVAGITHDGTTYATVTTRRPHRLTAGNRIVISNVGTSSDYEAVKCERDLGYAFAAAGYDVALGTNYNAVFIGIAETNSIDYTSNGVINAFTLSRNASAQLSGVSGDSTATTRSNAYWNEILNIINNGRSAASTVTWTDPSNATASQIAAKTRLLNNMTFIQNEINAWVALTYPNYDHDVAKCTRDVKYAVNALVYDILYGGNSATYDQAKFFDYYNASNTTGIVSNHRLQTVAAYGRLKTIVAQIVLGQTVTKTTTGALPNGSTQDTTGSNASSGDASTLQTLVQITADVVAAQTQAAANLVLAGITKTYPSVTWATVPLQTAKTAIDTNKTAIIANIVRGAPYTTPASGTAFQVTTVLDDFRFKYVTNGIPYDLQPRGFPNLFVESWSDAVVRAGMFDDQNGMFYEYDGKSLYCVRRNSTKQLGGTFTAVNRSPVLNGVNTNFTKQLKANDMIVLRGMSYKVTKVVSNTQLYITPSYRGTSRTGIVGTLTQDLRVPQSEWSVDKADGTGKSGYVLDTHKMQMAYMDYSWYGAGKVRFGFKGPDGHVMYVHEFIHNNKETEAYLRSGNLPARYEIKNGDAPTYAPSLYHWGASVIMDGKYEDDKAYLFTVASGSGGSDTISIPQTLVGLPVPILSIRLAPSVDSSLVGALGERDIINRMSINLQQVGLVVGNTNSKPASVKLVLNGALSQQAYFANYGAPSLTQVIKHTGVASDSINGGVTIYEFRAAVNSPVTADIGELAEMGNSVMGGDFVYPNGPDVITVCIVPTDTSAVTTVTARLSWKESQA